MGPLDEFGDEVQTRSNKTRFLVLSAVIILALGYMIYAAFPGNALYFLTVSEFNEKSRSEEHTSELQSRTNLVCRLLLEKKKKQ